MSAIASGSENPILRQARLAQAIAVVWMLVEFVVAVGAGVLAHSVALVAFGLDSAVEVASAAAVGMLLVTRTSDAASESMTRSERRTSRFVGFALYTIAAYIVLSAVITLVLGIRPEPSTPGVVLALAALIVMPVLWRWRLHLSERLHSPALRGDAACSLVCIYMAATLLGGLALNGLFHWWWADPLAGLAMIWWIRKEAVEAIESARTGVHCDDCAPAHLHGTQTHA